MSRAGDELGARAGLGDVGQEAELADIDDMGLEGEGCSVDAVAADDDEVGVEGLGDAQGGGAAGLEGFRKAEMVEGVDAVFAGKGLKAGGGEAAVEDFRGCFADPVEAGPGRSWRFGVGWFRARRLAQWRWSAALLVVRLSKGRTSRMRLWPTEAAGLAVGSAA